jgi:dipeptidase E
VKLLLTSAGITTQAIADKLFELIGNGNKKVGFVATAMNVEPGSKDNYISQILNLRKFGFNWIDFVDPSALDVDWKGRLSEVGLVFVCGGNTFHLLDQVRKTGFDTWLKEHIEHVVYVGDSAGSIIVTPSIGVAPVDNGDENLPGITDLTGLGLVDF